MFFMQSPIKTRIMIGFLPIILILGLWTLASHINFNRFSSKLNYLLKTTQQDQEFLEIEEDLIKLQRNLLMASHNSQNSRVKETKELHQQLDMHLNALRPMYKEKNDINKMFESYSDYKAFSSEIIENWNNTQALDDQVLEKLIEKNYALLQIIINTKEINQTYQKDFSTKMISNIDHAKTKYIFLSIITGIIGLSSALLVSIGISKPIRDMTATLSRLAKGDYTTEIPGQNRKDEIGKMAKAAEDFKVMASDLNEQKKLAQQNLNFNNLIMSNIPDLVFVKDSKFRIVQANDIFMSLYPEEIRDSVIGTTTLEQYPEEEVEKLLKNDREAFETGFNETEEKITFPNGDIRTLITKKIRFTNESGESFILGISKDITDIKKTAIELQKQKDLLVLAEKTADLGHWYFDAESENLFWSDQVYTIHGTTPAKYKPSIETALNFYHPDDKDSITAAVENLMETKESFELEKRIITQNGQMLYIHTIGKAELDTEGNIIGIFGIFQNITDRKTAEKKLLRSNEELNDFAYIASHDLKEPLRGIHNYANFILEDYEKILDEDGQHKLNRMLYLSQRMEKLINDLLYYSRLSRSETSLENIDVKAIITDIKSMLADQDNTTITIKGELPAITGDSIRIEELFRNLITNAIKYNDNKHKQIEIGISEENNIDKSGDTIFYIKDNGIGIDPKFHNDVFKIFKRLHKKEDYGGGTGSGLTFVKKIIDQHKGEIWLDSNLGEGTTFFFTLPTNHQKDKK